MRALSRGWMNVKLAFGSLRARPGRTALTLLGIVIGIVALVVMMALTHALETTVVDATEPLGAGVFQIQREPRVVRRNQQRRGEQRRSITLADARALEERLTRVQAIAGEMWDWGSAI